MSAGQTNLLTSWEEEEETLEGGFRVIRVSASGERHKTAITAAVVDRYNAILGRPRPQDEELYAMSGQKVTLIQAGENIFGGQLLNAHEGKLVTGDFGLGIIPKGARTKGFKVNPERVLDVIPGYETEQALEFVKKVRQHFPKLKPLTQDRLDEMPSSSESLSLCVFGSYRMPDSVATDALVLMSEYDKENDIVDGGVVLLRPEYGVSEHGSVYGRQLLSSNMGEVVGFDPISFSDGIKLCELDFDEAFYLVTCWQTDAA